MDLVSLRGNRGGASPLLTSSPVSGAKEAPRYCYDKNTGGRYYAFCRRLSSNQYIPCQPK